MQTQGRVTSCPFIHPVFSNFVQRIWRPSFIHYIHRKQIANFVYKILATQLYTILPHTLYSTYSQPRHKRTTTTLPRCVHVFYSQVRTLSSNLFYSCRSRLIFVCKIPVKFTEIVLAVFVPSLLKSRCNFPP